jgi:hypothetical protein
MAGHRLEPLELLDDCAGKALAGGSQHGAVGIGFVIAGAREVAVDGALSTRA